MEATGRIVHPAVSSVVYLSSGGEPTLVNGRFCYALRRAPERMLWWANGYWHAGLRSQVGEQTALLIAGDAAAVPEHGA